MDTRNGQWDQLFMRFANDVANMSSAKRLKVGAVAVRDRRVIAIGYNGTPPGEDNCCEYVNSDGELVTKDSVIHAEANLIKFSGENGIDLKHCVLYITHSPCPLCAVKIYEAGFSEIVYGKQFRDTSALKRMSDVLGIKVREWN